MVVMSKEKFDYFINGEKDKYEVIIGLEVHAQVLSNSKLFSGSSTKFGASPNNQVSLIDSAFPGMLPVINGKDSIIQAQSGTGKTGTFSISAIQLTDIAKESCQVIILSPTREIADQSYNVILTLGHYIKEKNPNFNICPCIGGRKLNNESISKSQIIVGTPGRILT